MDIKVFIAKKDELLTITSPVTGVIARQYDNNAHTFVFVRPDEYQDHDLVLVFASRQKSLGEVNIGMDNTYDIPNSITVDSSLRLVVRFVDGDTYQESANALTWTVESSLPSEGDVPESLPNEFKVIREKAICGIDVVENTLYAFNVDDNEVDNVILPTGSGGGVSPSTITTDDVVGLDGDTKLSVILEDMMAKDVSQDEDIEKKVDAVDGKQLSTNDYTNTDKAIVDGFDAFYELVNEKFEEYDLVAKEDSPVEVTNLLANPSKWGIGTKVGQFYKIYGDASATGLPAWWLTSGSDFKWIGLVAYVTSGTDEPSPSAKLYLFRIGTVSGGSDIAKNDYSRLVWLGWDGLATYSYVDGELEKIRDLIPDSGIITVNDKVADENGNVNIGPSDMTLDGLPTFQTVVKVEPEDDVLIGIAKLNRAVSASQYQATAEKSGSLITIQSLRKDIDWTGQYGVIFDAPSDFSPTDTYYINGASVSVVDETGHTLVNAWTEGTPVALLVKGTVAYFPGSHIGQNPYSLTTRAVDVWHDGRIVYEMVVEVASMPNSDTLEISHGINDMDFTIMQSATAMVYDDSFSMNRRISLNFISADGSEIATYSIYDDVIAIISNFDMSNYSGKIIFRYVEVV